MSYGSVCEFYKRALEEKKFSADIVRELRVISSKGELKEFISEKVCPIAKSMGYDFTADDLLSYEIEAAKRLSEEELESISGGAGVKNLILGGLVSLFTVCGSAMLSSAVHAELSSEEVNRSLDMLSSIKTENPEEDQASVVKSVASVSQSSGKNEVLLQTNDESEAKSLASKKVENPVASAAELAKKMKIERMRRLTLYHMIIQRWR